MSAAVSNDSAHSSDWAFKQLFKLESKCRSPVPASQVEAIGEFPKLLDQFPFPTLVSSAFLKLGDLFRSSPNSLRYHIAQVFEASQHHLAQITQTEELLKRVVGVLYSNDPIARVLALRLIGNASAVFAKYPEAQHGILLRYQSLHPLELVAAVQTTEALLKYSPSFLSVVWKTVLSKADDVNMPDPVRVQLIRSLQHAAPNLTLSTVLYPYCQRWTYQSEVSAAIQSTALHTWKAIIQRHNELQFDDAEHISRYLAHKLGSIRCAALALLGKWQPKSQLADAEKSEQIKQRLRVLLKQQLLSDMEPTYVSELRLAAVVLARIEALSRNESSSWEAAQALASRAGQAFETATPTLPTAFQADTSTRTGVSPLLRYMVSGTMLAINIASILQNKDCQSRAAALVRDTWQALSKVDESASETKYIRRFLRVSWSWCKSVHQEPVVLESLKSAIGTPSKTIAWHIITIGASAKYFNCFADVCQHHVASFVDGLASGNFDKCAVWQAIMMLLAYRQQCLDMSAGDTATNAITQWSEHMRQLSTQPAAHADAFASTGPPGWIIQRIMAFLAASSYWEALHKLCQALPIQGLSSNVQSWLHVISNISAAEASVEDSAAFFKHIDLSLRTLRVLDKSTACTFRLLILQLRREFVRVHHEWKQMQLLASFRPAVRLVVDSLASSVQALVSQAELCENPYVDSTTQKWLSRIQQKLRSAALELSKSIDTDNPSSVAAAVLAEIGEQCMPFTPGRAFFVEPPRPAIAIETRPDFENTSDSFAVFSGTEFHFAVEGFLRLPIITLPTTFCRIHIAVWLSRQPRESYDLQTRTKYYEIAQAAVYHSNGPQAENELESTLDRATLFEVPLVDTYFTCPCAISMPSLRAIFDHVDVNIILYVHLFCGLVDSSNRTWWTGPHASYPLLVSTTAKS
ncbi:hypothetical protein IWW36_002428 [Coemansia brasiliensis]|uniref:Integrator complex subunit 7 N-terminal domain-containing protein n=1 Tax=Coemansia brasiliensis TaxID=2650707 RepID=A0A9W8IES4_9FUNG|nr:hypothetical protein IWW36_002428 [Coemansia brasiliensis]